MLGMDFGDAEMRIMAQLHDETIVEFKSGHVDPRTAMKQLMAYSSLAAYGGGKTDDMMDAARVMYGGSQFGSGIVDAFRVQNLTGPAAAWQKALHEVLGVRARFYAGQSDEKRRAMEQRFTAMARGNPAKSHKAAVARKVLVARVKYALDDEEPRPKFRDPVFGSVTGRFSGGPAVINQISKRYPPKDMKLVGDKIHSIIVDEFATFKKP